MKLVTFRTPDRKTHAGVVHGERVTELDYPSVLELLRDPDGLAVARRVLELAEQDNIVEVPITPIAPGAPMAGFGELPVKVNVGKEYMLNELVLLAPFLIRRLCAILRLRAACQGSASPAQRRYDP